MKRATPVYAVVLGLLLAGCSGRSNAAPKTAGGPGAVPTRPGVVGPARIDPSSADAKLIITMYDDISRAFQRNPDDGVRAIIAAQDPQDRLDVDLARCIDAIMPGAKTLPRTKKVHFVPNVATITLDPGYTLTSDRVAGLHPRGRIYATDVTITDGGRPRVHERHQVVVDGKAYQFSAC